MNMRSLILIVIAVAIAGVAAIMARSLIAEQPAKAEVVEIARPSVTKQILVAAKPLPIGRMIEAADLKWQSWPDEAMQERYFTNANAKVEDFTNKVVRHSIVAGEPVTSDKVVGQGESGFLAAVLKPGMRAVSVAINQTTGIAGFVFPGDRVDMILSHEVDAGDAGKRQVSETVLYNVRVLAVDRDTNDQANTPKVAQTVTLEVTPKIAEIISVVRQLGGLSLSLRSLANENGENDGPLLAPNLGNVARSHTWDADVSSLLPQVGGARDGLTVVRGVETTKVQFTGSVQ